MTQAAEVLETETPTLALVRVTRELEPEDAASVRDALGKMFERVGEWQGEARGLVVTSEDQRGKADRARSLRLEIKRARVDLDKRRKVMKAGLILKGRAIDGAFAIFESMSSPLETFLLEQETFAERAEKARRDVLRNVRAETLAALGVAPTAMPAALGEITEDAWTVILDDAKGAKEARKEKAAQEERIRVEAARLAAEKAAADKADRERVEAERRVREEEQRQENERLKVEAEERERVATEERKVAAEALRVQEAAARAERERIDEERRAEREKHEAELAEQKRVADANAEIARRVQEELDAKRDAEASAKRAEEDRLTREAARSDNEVLLALADGLRNAQMPTVQSDRAKEILGKIVARLGKLAEAIEGEVRK
jgi:hypothetical protein